MTSSQNPQSLHEHLRRAFGWTSFRANQEEVCQAAICGRDVLLVMPTGSGKSLCYQLPAIVRGGAALVVSPLIALMDDQAAKLTAMGFSAARIHSGLERSAARQACIDYLNGKLQFLFIAPERLRVPGFPEMLAKRKPSLIAIDEAHCISQWGHDFRPDYRMLSARLDSLRPAPVIALTATATPLVQRDIVAQLGLINPSQFIHGFRRDNLAIEVVKVPLPQRAWIACELLRDPSRRPAILYTSARKHADTLAAELSREMPAAAYHAGLEPEIRERVQEQFLLGHLEVVVATIAFGMGIDKPNVRTVIHTALPGSLEGYYQEIGRAGRDGELSHTILMHSFADQRTHDFFLTRDYPPEDALDEIFRALGAQFRTREQVLESLRMDAEVFDKALDKLTIYGGAELDYAGNLKQGHDRWRNPYAAQADHRRMQMALVLRFAESDQCRMSALVRHFGDFEDGERACGICDFCDTDHCLVQRFRAPTQKERTVLAQTVAALRQGQSLSTGKLHQQLPPASGLERNEFEEILGAMTRAGITAIEDAAFQKDGKTIPYRKVRLTERGHALHPGSPVDLRVKTSPRIEERSQERNEDRSEPPPTARSRRKAARVPPPQVSSPTNPLPQNLSTQDLTPQDLSPQAQKLEERLRAWRQSESKALGVPAYIVLHDRTLRAIAFQRPANLSQLLAIGGIGPSKAEKYGAPILGICSES